ncbi:DUF4355 domain-containing protein [Schinkia azotoformans]|uniref:DUF4355 domain-containing protein n=1 Tax=Schinkia azotoformans TaxID=1454 RepID=UPI002DBD502D|nr:DUF4355 domain-containing protein [Schinkia azotoformans]MEC1780069.1 DUF4355 domain-containing protein [Schinkia azotoformans]MED4330852.1 DUF4355 domain-containing protein [Schinkia azotoformans]
MNLEEIKKFFEEKKEDSAVKEYLEGLQKPTLEGIQKAVSDNADLKKWFDSQKDQHFDKGLKTWMEKTFPTKLEEEIAKRYPDETPEQKRIKELELKFQEAEQRERLAQIKAKALSVASEKAIPTSIIDFFIDGENEDNTLKNLDSFKESMESYVKSEVEQRLKGSYQPPNNNGDKTNNPPSSFIDVIRGEQRK